MDKEQSVIYALQQKARGINYEDTAKELCITDRTLRNWRTEVGTDDIEALCEQHGVDINSVTGGWVKGKTFSLRFKESELPQQDIMDRIEKRFGKVKPMQPGELEDSQKIGILGLSDIHIGKPDTPLGKYFQSAIRIVDKMKIDGVNRIIFCVGNDALNVDNVQLTTTRGTPQEMEVGIDEAIDQLTSLYEGVIEYINYQNIEVDLMYSAANHDNILSYTIVHGLCRRYDLRNCLNLESRNYITYGKNLLGFTHGDKAKDSDLPSLMSVEAPKEWGNATNRYVFRGHKHHKERKDFRGCTVIGMRSLSAPDKWHRDSGYIGVPRATEGFVVDREKGIVAEYIESIN